MKSSLAPEITLMGRILSAIPIFDSDLSQHISALNYRRGNVERSARTTHVTDEVSQKATNASSMIADYGDGAGFKPNANFARIGFRIARTIKPSRLELVNLPNGKVTGVGKGLSADLLQKAAHESLPHEPMAAVGMLELAIATEPTHESALFDLAVLQVHLGNLRDHSITCKKMLEIARSDTSNFPFLERTAKSCLLVPKGPYDHEELLSLAQQAQQQAAQKHPNHQRYICYFDLTLALAQLRNGLDGKAVNSAKRSLVYQGKRDLSWDAGAHAVLSLAHFQMGNKSAAEQSCKLAAGALADSREDAKKAPGLWLKHLRSTILYDEAAKNFDAASAAQ